MPDAAILSFDGFELSIGRRTLSRDGRNLRIGSRAMDILLLLAERPGELVTKEEIRARLWPDVFVEEAGLRVHVSALRKALSGPEGDPIRTVAGRGYILAAPVTRFPPQHPAPRPSFADHGLPLRLERLIGRDAAVASLAQQVLEKRFVTVLGPGGIGKTSVALAVAAHLAEAFADGVRFVDLATLDDPETAAGALAIALGLPAVSEVSPKALAAPLAGKRLLVVLDNCERLADAAATVAEALLRAAPGLCVLATSREALRAEGEWVHRLPPLATPSTIPGRPDEALRFSAVELFVERANAASGGYSLSPADCPGVAEICRRLDGLPLAIELAATNLASLGVSGILAGLDDRLTLLTGGRRTAQSRHQTLRAALDWSYDLLGPAEQAVFSRLSVIAGRFDFELACAVANGADGSPPQLRAILDDLARKSLIATETRGGSVHYRLLETNRVYGAGKLADSAEADIIMRRYAEATLAFFRAEGGSWANIGSDAWLGLHAARLEDARAVLDWAFAGRDDDTLLGRAITTELTKIWLHLGLVRECLSWCRRALAAPLPAGAHADAFKMQIQHAFGVAHGFTLGNDRGGRPPLVATLDLAQRLGDHDYVMRGLWSMASLELNEGKLDRALDYARQLRDTAAGAHQAAEQLVGERLMGCALHLLGRHSEARPVLERVGRAFAEVDRSAYTSRFQFDQLVLTQGFLAWIDWIGGDAEAARAGIEATVAEAVRGGQPASLGFALDSAITLAILRGELDAAERTSRRLGEMGANIGFDIWMIRAEIQRAIIQVRSGDAAGGLPRLQAALPRSAWSMATYRTPYFLAEMAQAEMDMGAPEKALATIDDAIGWFGGTDDFWCAPECFRVKAEVLRQHGGANATREADALLERAHAVAERHGAQAWLRRLASADGPQPIR